MCALILMPFTECQSYIKSAKDTESRAKLKPDCTAEFADVLIAVQSAPYFLNPGLTGFYLAFTSKFGIRKLRPVTAAINCGGIFRRTLVTWRRDPARQLANTRPPSALRAFLQNQSYL